MKGNIEERKKKGQTWPPSKQIQSTALSDFSVTVLLGSQQSSISLFCIPMSGAQLRPPYLAQVYNEMFPASVN
jgi:hypothetical protein